MTLPSQAERGEAFAALHERGEAFIIPNPWDAGSARVLAGRRQAPGWPLHSAEATGP